MSRQSFINSKLMENCSPNTITSYELVLKQFQKPSKGKLTEGSVKKFVNSLMARKVKPSSIRQKLACLREYYKFERRDFPSIHIKVGQRIPKFLNDSEVGQIRGHIKSKRDLLIFDIMFSTGLRVSEFTSLHISDFQNCSTGEIKITGKGDKQRIMYVSEELVKRVLDFYESANGKLFELNRMTIHNIMSKYGRLIGRIVSPHMLRHSFATKLINNGADIMMVRDLLGHSSVATTQIYTHMNLDKRKFFDLWKGGDAIEDERTRNNKFRSSENTGRNTFIRAG